MKSRIILLLLFLTSVVGLSLTMAAVPPAAAAVGTTYIVTSTSCTGPGSIVEAIALANANPGEDTIELTPGLKIEAATCPPISEIYIENYFIAAVTDSLIIEGNGGALIGHMTWINQSGHQTFSRCPNKQSDYLLASVMPGFLRIGEAFQDNPGLQVTIKDLRVQEFNQVAAVHKKASLVLEDVYMKGIWAWRWCTTPAIEAYADASVTLLRTTLEDYISFDEVTFGSEPALGAIDGGGGSGAGDLTIEDSKFFSIDSGYPQNTIHWTGAPNSKVNIVSTLFGRSGREDSPYLGRVGGIHIAGDAETNIVNSLWNNDIFGEVDAGDQIMNRSSNDMNIIASTLIWNSDQCDPDKLCSDPATTPNLISRIGTGRINFKQSAIGLNFVSTPPEPSLLTLFDIGTGGFTADADTWIQPTQRQNSAALSTITGQPALRTDPPAFDIPYYGFWSTALGMPSLGTTANPGQLLDVIDNSSCTPPNDGNKLINPIDGSCIDKDVLGGDRWDTSNNKRNIGALQLAQAPLLQVVAVGDGAVELNWTHTAEPPSGPITGYVLAYREKTPTSTWLTVNISGAGTLAYKITGLTNGVEYEFQVEGTVGTDLNGQPILSGYPSNTVTGIPLGPIGPPVVTATPGNGQVDLSWTKPAVLGGHEIEWYLVRWRRSSDPVNLFAGNQLISAPTTQFTVTGLTNGQEYVFDVRAISTDGTRGAAGTTSATPVAPGMVRISKYTFPGGGTGFSFTQDFDNSGDFTLDDQGHKNFTSVAPGTYTVTETDPQGLGYEVSKVSCFEIPLNSGAPSTGDPATRTATINMDAGEYVQCVFVNMEEHSVVIEKRTIPPGGSGFTFSDNIGTPNNFSLDDAEIRTFTHVKSGDYQVIEAEMPGYELTAIDCLIGTGDLASRTANISLIPGEREHCTFTNTKLGTLIMRKETLPDGAPDQFGFGIQGPDYIDAVYLSDGDMEQVDNAKSGTWLLAEGASVGWHLGDISCTSTLGTSTFAKDIDNLNTTVELAPGDTMDCTFTNVEDETITVEKVTVPAGDTTTSFAFTGSGSIGGFALKDGEKQSFSVVAEAGPYTLTESDPSGAGYEVTDIRCVNTQTGEITLGDVRTRSVLLNTQPGESQHCTFTNERHGQVVIRKATAPANAPNNTEFGFYGSFNAFSLKDGQEETFLDVTPGAYSVSEVDPSGAGYGLKGISCIDSDPSGTPSTGDLPTHTASINLDAGETVECTFTNSLPNTVSVFKTTIPPGGAGFGFGGNFGTFTLDDGDLTSFDVSPGSSYTISEDENADYDLAFILCNDASTGDFFEGDVVNRQVTLGPLQEGQQILCEFLNVQRGTIIIEKAPGSGTGYGFSGDLGDFTLDSGQEQTFINQPVGQYSVTEQTPPGDVLTGLTCTDSDANGVPSTGNVAANTATINLDPGETVRCTYSNQAGGSVVIKKTVDSGPDGPFTFLDNIATPATFELNGGEEQRFDGILPGTYTVQESGVPDGSGLADIVCVDSDGSGTPSGSDLSAATAVILLDPGETVECTFTNEVDPTAIHLIGFGAEADLSPFVTGGLGIWGYALAVGLLFLSLAALSSMAFALRRR